MRTAPVAAVSVVVGLVLAGCAGTQDRQVARDPAPDASSATPAAAPTAMPTSVPSAPGLVRPAGTGLVTILDDGHGPEVCLGGELESLPPQCGGPPATNWDWSQHTGTYREVNGVRWGEYGLTGRFDGTSFVVTGAIPSAVFDPGPTEPVDELGSPCAAPEGGWQVVDPALTNQATLDTAMEVGRGLPGYSAEWVDQSINPADPTRHPEAMNDPHQLVVDVSVTDDLRGAQSALRAVWGGALCVSRAAHTEAELRTIVQRLRDLPGLLSSNTGPGGVQVSVRYDDGSLQRWADATYGTGTVTITSALVDAGPD